MDAPCYKCTKRRIGCHSSCDMYRKYDAENKKRRERRQFENMTSRADKTRLVKHCDGKGRY